MASAGRLSALFLVASALVGAAAISAYATRQGRAAVARCADSVYQTPSTAPPKTVGALRVGPVLFNRLAPAAHDVDRPTSAFPYYGVASFLDVLTAARRGVRLTVASDNGEVALVYSVAGPGSFVSRLRARRASLADGPGAVVFPLCHDLITQYGLSVLLRKPGCLTIRVQPLGTRRTFRARVRVLVPHC